MRYTFHDFRRIFVTDAIMHGLPPHIAALVVGHRDVNTTMGYKNPRELHQAGEKLQVAC
jgi:integrase